jgi:hypothetical protein
MAILRSPRLLATTKGLSETKPIDSPHIKPKEKTMTASPANPSRINEPRCTQIFSNGKRCRLFAKPNSTLCPKHAGTEAEELTTTLTGGLDEFTSAAPINQFLSRLLLLLAQDRISPRRGAVMAYTANLLLRSVSVMEHETAGAAQKAKKRPLRVIWGLPCPPHEPVEPEPYP